ncbi:MAG TPA: glycosyltransferase family 2 protein [Burkholderiales bacterium]|nr:glycosyltransferase family 2 protein [Burkholderiales bacterium]
MSQAEAGAAPPAVAVVIVNYNGGDFIERCLAALSQQTLAPRRVVVVDNASSDGSAERIERDHPEVQLIRLGRNAGFAAGNNAGIAQAADCEWIACLNPDAYAEPDWLARLLAGAAANPGFAFFGCRMVRADDPGRLDGTGDVYHTSGLAWRRDHRRALAAGTLEAGEIFAPCAAAALYRRADLLEVGGFDEDFFCYFEDVDLAFRLRLTGRRCRYVADSVVRHVGSAIAGEQSDFSVYHGHRNLVWAYFKNMPAALLWRYLPQHLLVNLLSVPLFAWRGHAGAVCRAKWDALAGLSRVLRQRKAIQASSRVGADTVRAVMATGLRTLFRQWFARRADE